MKDGYFEVGDWVVRTQERLNDNWAHGTKPMRVESVNTSKVCMNLVGDDTPHGHLRAGRASFGYFRPATPEEIAALPIRNGDVVVHPKAHECSSAACVHCTVHEAHEECHLGLDPCRHATPEEWREWHAQQSLQEPSTVEPDSKPGETPVGTAVDEALEQSDFGEGVTLDPEAVEATLAYLERRSQHAVEAQGALSNRILDNVGMLNDLDARLEALEAAVQCDHCRKHEHECMCEAEPPAPPEPELPPLLWDRITGKGPYVEVRESVDGLVECYAGHSHLPYPLSMPNTLRPELCKLPRPALTPHKPAPKPLPRKRNVWPLLLYAASAIFFVLVGLSAGIAAGKASAQQACEELGHVDNTPAAVRPGARWSPWKALTVK